MTLPLPTPPVLLITDRNQARWPLPEIVEASLAGGCRWVSVREKNLASTDRRRLCRAIVKLGETYGATVTLHGDLAGAEAARAHGVHVPFGTAPGAVKAILGKQALVGVSVHSWDEAIRAQEDGADYVTVSPIYETPSKPGHGPPLGTEILGELCVALTVPVVALGGITRETGAACLQAGAGAIAVMGTIMRADDPQAEMRALIASCQSAP